MTIAATLLACSVPFSPDVAHASPCVTPSLRADVPSPTSMKIVGADVTLTSMANLWHIVTATDNAHETLGKAIAADQDWLGSCQYPGLGLGAGSGTTAENRTIIIWVWSTGVDLARARTSLYELIGQITTTTSTTTTTTTSTTTVPPGLPDTTTSTSSSTSTVPRTEPIVTSKAYAVAIGTPVRAQSITKVLVKKITAKKKTVVTIKITPKRKKK